MNLSLFIIIPLVAALAVLLARNAHQVKWISFLSSLAQLGLSLMLLFAFRSERAAGNTAQMLFEQRYSWFAPLHIEYYIGVDGISVAMILLTAFVVVAGVLV